VAAGLPTFSTPGGLYEVARKQYKLKEGKDLFTYNFYAKRPQDCNAFLADIGAELDSAKPTATHHGLAALHSAGRLVRHYTMNIDGIASKTGMPVWSEENPDGATVELHGNAHQVVCKGGHVAYASQNIRRALQQREGPTCGVEGCDAALRWRIMLYDDKEGQLVTQNGVLQLMEDDAAQADLILWLGISFEQSASTAYFRRIRAAASRGGRIVPMVIVNPEDDAVFNIQTAVSNLDEMELWKVLAPSDVLFSNTHGDMPAKKAKCEVK